MSEARHPARDAFERAHPIAAADLSEMDRRHVEEVLWHVFLTGWSMGVAHAMQIAEKGRGE